MITKKVEEQGMTVNEAIDDIMEEDIIEEFRYLENAGLNLKTVFFNWVKNNLKNVSRDDDDGRGELPSVIPLFGKKLPNKGVTLGKEVYI